MPFNHWGFANPYDAPQFRAWVAVQQAHMVQQVAQAAAQPPVQVAPQVDEDEGSMINDFRVGCDPEFMLLDATGKTAHASGYFPIAGEIGYDHNGRVAEFRPAPARGVYGITRKLQSLIKDKRIPNLRLRAGALCNGDCLGGHVHFGFNAFTQKPNLSALAGDGVYNDKGFRTTRALDALTKTLEHLDILPNNESEKRRQSAQGQGNFYGAYGDVRDCHGHMEYRSMASWLYDPKITFLCLTAAKLAAADPDDSYLALKNCTDFKVFKNWLNAYKGKDANAARASEKLLEGGLNHLQVDPSVDFRTRWETLGL